MTSHNVVYFKISRYHAGVSWSLEDASPIVSSDTFFGGLIWSYIELYGIDEGKAFLEKCMEGGLRISSLYPSRIGSVDIFPIPLSHLVKVSGILEKKKITKEKVYLVSRNIFEMLINGWRLDLDDLDYHHGVLYSRSEGEKHVEMVRVVRHRNVKDRSTDFTTPWRTAYYILGRGCGLRLHYQFRSNEFSSKKFTSAIRLLSENGLGGERSMGLGYSDEPPLFSEIILEEPNNGGYFTTFSLYYPLRRELEVYSNSRVSYELVERGGFKDYRIGKDRIAKIRMFREGSVFPLLDTELGCMVDVGGVYRYGFAYPVKVRWLE